jgi:ketosteroid isomerase-like protein
VTEPDHRQILGGFSDMVRTHDWDRMGEYITEDALWEYPQSGEHFRGLPNIRGQFENYPGMEPGTSELQEVIGGTVYALTPNYTLVAVDGSGDSGTAIVRVRYPDGSRWWAVNLYRLRDGKIAHSRTFFAPEFEPPEWRAPFREAESPFASKEG